MGDEIGSDVFYGNDWPSVATTPDPSAMPAASGDWLTQIAQVGQGLLTWDQQRRLQEINITRAQQGLPPLDASAYGYGVNVGLSPQTRQLLMYGGIALAGYLVLKEMRRGRR